jgi:hypothetical protein
LGFVALAGSLDGSHHLGVHGGGPGLQLILQHGRNCAGHHHGIVARALTLFARPASATNPDHVIRFGASDSYSQQAQLTAPAPAIYEQPEFALFEAFPPPPREGLLASIPSHPPPDDGGQLVCLRSTLLLI